MSLKKHSKARTCAAKRLREHGIITVRKGQADLIWEGEFNGYILFFDGDCLIPITWKEALREIRACYTR